MIYPDNKRTTLVRRLALLLVASPLTACGPINPNFQTIWQPNSPTYQVQGALTTGFSAHPRVAYVEAEGDNPDLGSFHKDGAPTSGIDQQGVYIPSSIVTVDSSGRFKITFTGPSRYVLIRLFAWDDVNNNSVRDTNETLSTVYQIEKNDLAGWKFNAPDWNEFNFIFSQ